MQTHHVLEVDIANSIIGREFFLIVPNSRNQLQVQDQRGNIAFSQITYDSPRLGDLLSYWDKAKAFE